MEHTQYTDFDGYLKAEPAPRLTAAGRPACSATRRDGNPCQGFAVRNGLCAGHAGLGLANPQSIARQQADRTKASKRAQRQQADELARQPLTSRLRAQAAQDKQAIITALFAPIHDDTLGPIARQQAALRILERVLGRPATLDEQPAELEGLTLEQLAQAWSEPRGEGDTRPDVGSASANPDNQGG